MRGHQPLILYCRFVGHYRFEKLPIPEAGPKEVSLETFPVLPTLLMSYSVKCPNSKKALQNNIKFYYKPTYLKLDMGAPARKAVVNGAVHFIFTLQCRILARGGHFQRFRKKS